jgi:hypothetical protein
MSQYSSIVVTVTNAEPFIALANKGLFSLYPDQISNQSLSQIHTRPNDPYSPAIRTGAWPSPILVDV